jgi:hypothetical protein
VVACVVSCLEIFLWLPDRLVNDEIFAEVAELNDNLVI